MPGALVKCVVWDLDNTLWDGVLLEDPAVSLRAGVTDVIEALDGRGIIQSVASRNEPGPAMAKLRALGLAEYFLYPQISWDAKSSSIRAIAEALNIGTDAIAFVDDDPFERDEVAFSLPSVHCIPADEVATLLHRAELTPAAVTEDSKHRRLLYLADRVRRDAEQAFTGPAEAFLASLEMRFRIADAREDDLLRAEELTVRTNQLNTTGRTYSYEELDGFRTSPGHRLLMAELEDRYGPYGTIGLALVETGSDWTIKLLLMSCRVMSRGVGTIVVNHIKGLAKASGVRLLADFVPTDRNRMMYVAYKFNRFREAGRMGDVVRLEADLDDIPPFPSYVYVDAPE